ncbi:MAG TPA: PAS domain-containing sensor histidine kinase [Pelobium sp.]|nr:PAS domain-containing sensor histidine kinase [Pelobium sp.]
MWNNEDDIIFVTDNNGIIKMINPIGESKLGYKTDELVDNKSMLTFLRRDELIKRAEKLVKEIGKELISDFSILTLPADLGLSNEFEITLVRKDKTSFPVSITLNKTDSHSVFFPIEGYVAIARDISEKKKIEQELIHKLEVERKLSDFRLCLLSVASHEFKTPLNVILFSASIISKYYRTEDQPKREKHLERIANSVRNLNDMLNELLSISKLEKPAEQPKNAHFRPREHIREIIEENSGLLKNGQVIRYRHTGINWICLDARVLKHIIVNLLSNAIKFSPESSKIFLCSKNTGDKFILSIKDNGCGISPEDQKRLFNRFYRGTNVSNIEGNGLGLYIVRNYLEHVKGSIDFSSKLNAGTKVKVSFPLAVQEAYESNYNLKVEDELCVK